MHRHHDSEESCRSASVVLRIAAGEPWTARKIRNNNLRQHCHLLARNVRPQSTQAPLTSLSELLEVIANRTQLFTAIHPTNFPVIPVLARIAAYSDRWIRRPLLWTPDETTEPRLLMRSLLQHLFALWPVPEFFDSAWLVKGELIHQERDWYCHLAHGGSLREVQGMPPSISSKGLHLAMSAPTDLTIRQGLRWGQLKALGASDALTAEVLGSRMVEDLSNDAIWSRLFQKFARAADFAPGEFGIIADTLLALISQDQEKKAEALVGLPNRELASYSTRFWQTMMQSIVRDGVNLRKTEITSSHTRYYFRILANAKWSAFLGDYLPDAPQRHSRNSYRYGIVELTQHTQLIAEGQAMKHCVGSYMRRCKQGWSAIFSLRKYPLGDEAQQMERCATIEVRPRTRQILQVRGKRNQVYRASQIPAIRVWAQKYGLTF